MEEAYNQKIRDLKAYGQKSIDQRNKRQEAYKCLVEMSALKAQAKKLDDAKESNEFEFHTLHFAKDKKIRNLIKEGCSTINER